MRSKTIIAVTYVINKSGNVTAKTVSASFSAMYKGVVVYELPGKL